MQWSEVVINAEQRQYRTKEIEIPNTIGYQYNTHAYIATFDKQGEHRLHYKHFSRYRDNLAEEDEGIGWGWGHTDIEEYDHQKEDRDWTKFCKDEC